MLIDIPGGRFRMGLEVDQEARLRALSGGLSPFAFHTERPAHEVSVRPFRLARTPVTNAQFAAFVEADGYARDEFWKSLLEEPELAGESVRQRLVDATGRPGPLTWRDGRPMAGREQHPVSGVSWFEAQAFCAFQALRLSTEEEWEFAARGTDGRLYPWGSEFEPARCAPGGQPTRDTFPVEVLPEGKSPFGVLQMVGNVAEWVEDLYQAYPGAGPNPGRSVGALDRVVRGDFYRGRAETLRVTVRTPHAPETRFPGLGFRCASDSMGASRGGAL